MKSIFKFLSVVSVILGTSAGITLALSIAPTPPLAERLQQAELIFAGTVIERIETGEWVRAVLRVDTPLHGVAEDRKRIEVIWRKHAGDFEIYDAEQGQRGIAILDTKHEGRYWLRADKFEPLAKMGEVRKLLGEAAAKRVPTFEEWVKTGKPIAPDRVFTGGTPWFDESTGKKRSDKEVYHMLFGNKATGKDPAESRFPAHWGDPPSVQTRDLRPLPGGYGKGSSTLARWIAANMEKDAKNATNPSD